ncbi:MAG: endonuclease V [Candidatus Hodarchaeales archaeon]
MNEISMKDILSDYSKIQSLNSERIVQLDTKSSYNTLAALSIVDDGNIIQSGVVIRNIVNNDEIFHITEPVQAPFPYVSSYLSLRYKTLVLETLEHIEYSFDVLLIYPGSGIQHPRKFGLASDIGLELDISVIGITKKPLVGAIDPLSVTELGDNYIYPVYHNNEKIAFFIRKKHNKNGIFISVGHNISLETSTKIITKMLRYRLPEPIREIRRLILRK